MVLIENFNMFLKVRNFNLRKTGESKINKIRPALIKIQTSIMPTTRALTPIDLKTKTYQKNCCHKKIQHIFGNTKTQSQKN